MATRSFVSEQICKLILSKSSNTDPNADDMRKEFGVAFRMLAGKCTRDDEKPVTPAAKKPAASSDKSAAKKPVPSSDNNRRRRAAKKSKETSRMGNGE